MTPEPDHPLPEERADEYVDALVPSELVSSLNSLAEAMTDAADPDQLICELLDVQQAVRMALHAGEDFRRRVLAESADAVKMSDCVRENVKRERELSDRTQEELAEDMGRLGFVNWKRITVAEVESGKRKLSWEELVGLAILFGHTVNEFFAPNSWHGRSFVLNERRVVHEDLLRELLGGDAKQSRAAKASAVVADVVLPGSKEDWRPAAVLINKRNQAILDSLVVRETSEADEVDEADQEDEE